MRVPFYLKKYLPSFRLPGCGCRANFDVQKMPKNGIDI